MKDQPGNYSLLLMGEMMLVFRKSGQICGSERRGCAGTAPDLVGAVTASLGPPSNTSGSSCEGMSGLCPARAGLP